MKYETIQNLKDEEFKRCTGVSREMFEKMLVVVCQGLRGFGRTPKLSRADQLDWHTNAQTPVKGSKLHPLTKEQKTNNRKLSHERILVENVIRRMKIFHILSERYRDRRKRFALRFNLIAAIHNLELKLTH